MASPRGPPWPLDEVEATGSGSVVQEWVKVGISELQ